MSDFNENLDEIDASGGKISYLIWLIQTGQAEILGGNNSITTYNPFSRESHQDFRDITPEECFIRLKQRW